MSNKVLGDRGESCAARYLGAQGYRILAQKYRTKVGEIDLIAKDRGLCRGKDTTKRSLRTSRRSGKLPKAAQDYTDGDVVSARKTDGSNTLPF